MPMLLVDLVAGSRPSIDKSAQATESKGVQALTGKIPLYSDIQVYGLHL
jgi:hypothetical protein